MLEFFDASLFIETKVAVWDIVVHATAITSNELNVI